MVCVDLHIFLCSPTQCAPGDGGTTSGHNSDQSGKKDSSSDISEDPQDLPCSARAMLAGHLKENPWHGSCFP